MRFLKYELFNIYRKRVLSLQNHFSWLHYNYLGRDQYLSHAGKSDFLLMIIKLHTIEINILIDKSHSSPNITLKVKLV